MATVVNQNTKMISITRGDTAFIGIKPKYRDTKEPYQFEAGDVVMFRFVKGNVYFEKRCEIDTVQNNCILTLSPEDTIGLPFDVYTYEIELIPISGGRFTFIAQKMFNVTFEVEKHILTAITESTYTAPANNQATANNTLLTAELRAMDVLDGDIDRTNGSVIEVIRKTTAEWVMFEDNVSKDGEIYVYTDYRTVEGVDLSATKIGDGETTIGELPFATLPITEDDIQKWNTAVQDTNYVHTDNNYDDTAKSIVDRVPEALAGKVDKIPGKGLSTNDYDSTAKNKVDSLGTASTRDVPESGDASTFEVVLGSDTRLSDSRNAKDVYAWAKASTKPNYTASEVGAIASTMKGTANGVAELDANGKVPSAQLPPYGDDVLEYPSLADFPASGASGKIYIALDTNKTYRWSGTTYVEISESLALGETESTAYAGNKGKANADNITAIQGLIPSEATPSNKLATKNDIPDISGKVDKETGKGLSTNDYTTEEKTKLAGISEGANKVESSETNGNIKIDGTEKQVYDDTDLQNAIDDIEDVITTDTSTVEGNPINFSTLSAQTAKSTILSLEPIQDLHGYPNPWVGGVGKNLLPLTIDYIKSINTTGTWSGNTYTRGTVTFTIITDSNSNVTGIQINGTPNADNLSFLLIKTNFGQIFNGSASVSLASNNSDRTYRLQADIYEDGTYTGTLQDGVTINRTKAVSGVITCDARLGAVNGTTYTNLLIKPQLEIGNSPTSFAPYTNICPITGRTEIGILGCGKNFCANNLFSAGSSGGVTYSIASDGKITLSASSAISSAQRIDVGSFMLKSGTYSLSGIPESATYINLRLRTNISQSSSEVANSVPGYPATFTLAEDTTLYAVIIVLPNYIGTHTLSPLVRVSTETNVYEPYKQSNDLTISIGQTVYGGTLDVENGVLVVDYELREIEDEDITSVSFDYDYVARIATSLQWEANNGYRTNGCCNKYSLASNYDDVRFNNSKLGFNSSRDTLLVHDNNFVDANAVHTSILNTPIQVAYPLLNPIEISLTPHQISLLKGVNNISTDGDKITLTYRDGSVATLGDLSSAVDNLDSKIDESKILTDTATGDKYILVVTNGVLGVQQISN